MTYQYRLISNETYYVEGAKRFRASKPKVLRSVIFGIKVVGVLVLVFGFVASIFSGHYMTAIPCLVSLVFIFCAKQIDLFVLKRNVRKSPHFNDDLMLNFSDDGMHAKSELLDLSLTWSSFSELKKVDGGFLLFQGPKYYNWLPGDAIVDSSQLSGVRELLEKNVRMN